MHLEKRSLKARAEPHNADETHADSFHNYALITSSIIIRGAFTIASISKRYTLKMVLAFEVTTIVESSC